MNFYEEEPQFRALLKELLDEEFFAYADRELSTLVKNAPTKSTSAPGSPTAKASQS